MVIALEPFFESFFYPICPVSKLKKGPFAFTLMKQPIILWLDESGEPAAIDNKCCHRWATLTNGKVVKGNIQCSNHGWEYNSKGQCVKIPHYSGDEIPARYKIKAYHCKKSYDYVWVALKDPIMPIPDIPEFFNTNYRTIHFENRSWRCSPLAGIENNFDNAHHHYVHTQLGDKASAVPRRPEAIQEMENGLYFKSAINNYGNPLQAKAWNVKSNSKMNLPREFFWFIPFTVKMVLYLPNDLCNITIYSYTPIDETTCLWVSFIIRNDREVDVKTSDIVELSMAISYEDEAILEQVSPDVPLSLKEQKNMESDYVSLLIRKRLLELSSSYYNYNSL
ncbi:aromatic ring-hydroxylating oxygenase subunit alpha [Zooshikella harenae]|uniref:Aromatic ring-hydroxylating dioxygenase subunit alpha n=1 Tax=Zooshikella harenae TaxID=2827238 RepID=A0ABS5ZJ01_9GAMM|nr:aromatic ring-hydroxylating dioxygenase subunit alpha [Zooshikella harenae]MBU2714066.1 aromatic ring-hydroxylating dioxygenase subunit alpha [Zooshikella harenae]